MKSFITIALLVLSASAFASAVSYEDAFLVIPQNSGYANQIAPILEKDGLRLQVSMGSSASAKQEIANIFQNQGGYRLVYQDAMIRKYAVQVNGQCTANHYIAQNYNQYGYNNYYQPVQPQYQKCQAGSQFVIQALAQGKSEEVSQEEASKQPAAVETNSYSNQSVLIEIPQVSALANNSAPVVIVNNKRLVVSQASSPQALMAFQQMYSNQGGFQMIIQDQMTRRFKARITGSCSVTPMVYNQHNQLGQYAQYNQYPAANGPCVNGGQITLESLVPVTSSESAEQDQVEGSDERSAGDEVLEELEKPISDSSSASQG